MESRALTRRQVPMELGRFVGADQPATPSFAMKMQVHQLRKQVSALAGGASGAELAEILLEREEEISQLVRENKALNKRITRAEQRIAATCAAAVARSGYNDKTYTAAVVLPQTGRKAAEAYAIRERLERQSLEKELEREATKRAREAKASAYLAEKLSEIASQNNLNQIIAERDRLKEKEKELEAAARTDRNTAELATQELAQCRQELGNYCDELREALETKRIENEQYISEANSLRLRCNELSTDRKLLNEKLENITSECDAALTERDAIRSEYNELASAFERARRDDNHENHKALQQAHEKAADLEIQLEKHNFELEKIQNERDLAIDKYEQLRLDTESTLEKIRTERDAALDKAIYYENESHDLKLELKEIQTISEKRACRELETQLEKHNFEHEKIQKERDLAIDKYEQLRLDTESTLEKIRTERDKAIYYENESHDLKLELKEIQTISEKRACRELEIQLEKHNFEHEKIQNERDLAIDKYEQLRLDTESTLEKIRTERDVALDKAMYYEKESHDLKLKLKEIQTISEKRARRELEGALNALEQIRNERDQAMTKAEKARLALAQALEEQENRLEVLKQNLDQAREERDIKQEQNNLLENKVRELQAEREDALSVADAALANRDEAVREERQAARRMATECDALHAALAARQAQLNEALAAKDISARAALSARNELDLARESLRKAVAHTAAERNGWATDVAKAREASAIASKQFNFERDAHTAADAIACAALAEICRATEQASASASYKAARDAVLERDRLSQAAREARQREAEYRRQADRAELRSETSIHEIQQLRDELREARKQLLNNNATTPLPAHRSRDSADDIALAARARMQTARILRDATARSDHFTKSKQSIRRLPAHLEEYDSVPPATPVQSYVDYLNTPTRAAGPGARVLTEITTAHANRNHLTKHTLKEGAPPKRPNTHRRRTPKPPSSRSSVSSYVI